MFGTLSPFWIRKPVPLVPVHFNVPSFANNRDCFDMLHPPVADVFEATALRGAEKKFNFFANTDLSLYPNNGDKFDAFAQSFAATTNAERGVASTNVGLNEVSELDKMKLYAFGTMPTSGDENGFNSMHLRHPQQDQYDRTQSSHNSEDSDDDRIDIESPDEQDSHISDSIESLSAAPLDVQGESEDLTTKMSLKPNLTDASSCLLLFNNYNISNSLNVKANNRPTKNDNEISKTRLVTPPHNLSEVNSFKTTTTANTTLIPFEYEHSRSAKHSNTRDFRIETLIGNAATASTLDTSTRD